MDSLTDLLKPINVKTIVHHNLYPLLINCLIEGDEVISAIVVDAIKCLAETTKRIDIIFSPDGQGPVQLDKVAAQLYMGKRVDRGLRSTGLRWNLPPWPGFCALVYDHFALHSDYEVLENSHSMKQYNTILATMIAAKRSDLDNFDELVRNTIARAFSVIASTLDISAFLPFLKAVCQSKKSWQAWYTGIKMVQQIAILMGCTNMLHLKFLFKIIEHGLSDVHKTNTCAYEAERGTIIKSTAISLFYEMTEESLKSYKKCGRQKLEVLDFDYNTITGVEPSYPRFTCLKSLSLRHVSISALDLSLLVAACPKMESLALDVLEIVTPDSQSTMELISHTLKRLFAKSIGVDKIILNADNLEVLHLNALNLELFELIEKGIVAFSAGLHGWAFTLSSFDKMYVSKFGVDESNLMERLWGENFSDPTTKKWTTMNTGSATRKRGFVQVYYGPIKQIIKTCMNDQKDKLWSILRKLGVTLKTDEKELMGKTPIKSVMQTCLLACNALPEMMLFHLSFSSKAQEYRVENLYMEPLDDIYAIASRNCDLEGKFATGFEENKDFPIVWNSVIAGRYRVTKYLGSAACSKVVQEHFFIVTELLRVNLYDFQKEFGDELYFSLPRIQAIAQQCLEALVYLHHLNIVHCDLKPENILMKSYSRCEIKVIDLGSSCFLTENLSLYVQSRSYRAPEVILGLSYDQKIDIWSLGCVLAELYTGEVLFPNESVPMILARMIGTIGPIDMEMLALGQETQKYFTEDYDLFHKNEETDQLEYLIPEKSSLRRHLQCPDSKFVDFLSYLLQINPRNRPTASEALQHRWLSYAYR